MKIAETILMLLVGMQAVSPPRTYPISVSISTPAETVKSGEEIRVNVRVTNTSNHVVKILKSSGNEGPADGVNSADVTYDGGQRAPRIPNHQIFLTRGLISVKPGDSKEDFLIVSKLFDMSKPGRYTVLVRHELLEDDGTDDKFKRSFVPSNSISITVTP
jgi:hypothetical protein